MSEARVVIQRSFSDEGPRVPGVATGSAVWRPRSFVASLLWMTAVGSSLIGGVGCFAKPNNANIELRKELQDRDEKIEQLQTTHASDLATITHLSADRTVQTLPAEKLDRLFTTASIKFKNIVVGEDLDPKTPGDEGFKVGITPVDQTGDEFKAAGSLTIELFDLAEADPRLGKWTVDTAEANKKWLSSFVFDGFVLVYPWQIVPKHEKLLVKATFVDELTGGTFEAKTDLTIKLPTMVPTTSK